MWVKKKRIDNLRLLLLIKQELPFGKKKSSKALAFFFFGVFDTCQFPWHVFRNCYYYHHATTLHQRKPPVAHYSTIINSAIPWPTLCQKHSLTVEALFFMKYMYSTQEKRFNHPLFMWLRLFVNYITIFRDWMNTLLSQVTHAWITFHAKRHLLHSNK